MDTLERRIQRLARFEELLRDHPKPQPEHIAGLIREACMVIERIATDYPDSRETLRERLPELHRIAGTNLN